MVHLDKKKVIDFYWFSGTGNTLLVVRAMKKVFEQNDFAVNLMAIEKSSPEDINCSHSIGIGTPVAMQGTYPLVWDFVSRFPDCPDTPVFFVDTLMSYSGGILGPLKRMLRRKGFSPFGAREIKMPHNIFIRRKDDEIKQRRILERGIFLAGKFAEELISGKPSWRDIPLYSSFMSTFSRTGFTWRMFRKVVPLYVDHEVCTRCRLCEKICPVDNWRFNKTKNIMEWSHQCIFCMRCFSQCPVTAIQYGRGRKKQYKALEAADFL